MTGEQLKQLIAESIAKVGVPEADIAWVNMFLGEAEAVLATIRAAGLVIGETVPEDEVIDLRDAKMFSDVGLALVRVVE